MPEKTLNSGKQNPPTENVASEPWTLRQAANWILFRDIKRAQRASGPSLLETGFYVSQYDPNFPKRLEGESDAEIEGRFNAYREKRPAPEKDEGAGWLGAQAELIESLKNSEILARYTGNNSTTLTVPPDDWKMGSRTFVNPGGARVFSDDIMSKWKPNGHLACTSTESAFTDTIGVETSMRSWLESQIKAAPNTPLPKQTIRQQAIQSGISNVSNRAFERAYRAAVENSGCDAWSKGGRRPKSPHP